MLKERTGELTETGDDTREGDMEIKLSSETNDPKERDEKKEGGLERSTVVDRQSLHLMMQPQPR